MESTRRAASDALRRPQRRYTIRPAGRLDRVGLHHVVDTVTGEIVEGGYRVTFDHAARLAEILERGRAAS